MRFSILFFIFFLSLQSLAAVTDSLQQDAEPYGGIEQLAKSFFSIDFPIEIREKLDNQRIELIFYIDELGVPELEGLIGTDHPVIIDSFIRKTNEIPLFEAAKENDQYVESYYVLILTYPSVEFMLQQIYWQRVREFCGSEYKDFKSIEYLNAGMDLVIEGLGTTAIGPLNEYAGLGGGFNWIYTGNLGDNWVAGFEIMASFKSTKKDFPISSRNPLKNSYGLVNLGVVGGKWLDLPARPRAILFQMNTSFALLNVVERQGQNDADWDYVRGFGLGLSVHFPILKSNPKPNCSKSFKSMSFDQLNFHVGLRRLIMDYKEANGFIFEFGISYRYSRKRIKNWELK